MGHVVRRRAAVALVAALAVLVPAHTAQAAGTGGIEVTPLPFVVDGEPVTAFHLELPGNGSQDVSFLLRNVEQGERTATVYAAAATRLPDGGYDVGPADSSPYVAFDRRTVTLGTDEQRKETFRVTRAAGDRPEGTVHAALVVEVSNGSVVQRAATLIYLEEAPLLPVPLAIVLAVALLVLLGFAVPLVARRLSGGNVPPGRDEEEDPDLVQEQDVPALV